MECRQLFVLGLLLCVSLGETWLPSDSGRPQSKQPRPGGNSLSWSFPEDPVELVRKPPPNFHLQQPDFTQRFAVRCGNNRIHIEVTQDVLGLGRLAKAEEVTLGGCSPTEVDDESQVLVFESELHKCGSTRLMTDGAFIYSFDLVYKPTVSENLLITRSHRVVFQVECHYPSFIRKPHVNSGPLHPRPRGELQPQFSMQLMSDDWKSPRMSNKYKKEDAIRMQAWVKRRGHAPLRVLVDHCVATVEPAFAWVFEEAFIKNHGCLGGGLFGSASMAQRRPEELQFQIKAYSLPPQKLIRFSCILKAIPASSPTTLENKSCFFSESGWRAVRGRDQFCNCCAATCGMRKSRELEDGFREERWQSEESVGPIIIESF